jgi:hypothetical protein
MSRPFKTHAENAIWAIMEKGPVSTTEIGEIIEWKGKSNSLSAMVAGVWSRLGNKHEGAAGIFQRETVNGSYSYQKVPGLDMSVEAVIDKYKVTGRRQWAVRRDEKRDENKMTSPEPESTESHATKVVPEKTDLISEVITEAVQKVLGIEVKVTGRVEIVFKLGGWDGPI